jgi:hypothetical protein
MRPRTARLAVRYLTSMPVPRSIVRARVNAARRADCYQGIADTIVQLFRLHASGVIPWRVSSQD